MKASEAKPKRYYVNDRGHIIWIYPTDKVPKRCGQNMIRGVPYRTEGSHGVIIYGYLPADYEIEEKGEKNGNKRGNGK